MSKDSIIGLGLFLTGLWSAPAAAQDVPEVAVPVDEASVAQVLPAAAASAAMGEDAAEAHNGWEVAFTPYLWIAGTTGDIGIPRGTSEVEIDKSFTDILGNLNFAFMGTFDVERNRVVLLSDIMYLSVGANVEGIKDPQFFEGTTDVRTFLGSAAIGYRIFDTESVEVDLFGGGRVFSLDVELDLEGPVTSRSAEASKTTVSGLVGGRLRAPLGADWALGLYGDIGIGGAIKWQAMANVQYDISSHWRAIAGYRYMAIHHNKNDFEFDVNMGGPMLAVSYRF